jgi:hypothetical protein
LSIGVFFSRIYGHAALAGLRSVPLYESDLSSTVYPSGNFSAAWGKLVVDSGGVLVRNDFSSITVGAPKSPIQSDAKELKGSGWSLSLNPGWTLQADPARPGSLVAERVKEN